MAYGKKTEQDWDRINFKKSIDPRTGGYLHDSVALVSAGVEPTKENAEKVKKWLDMLWYTAEEKKKKLLEIKPVSNEGVDNAREKYEKGFKEAETESIKDNLNKNDSQS